MVEVCTPTSVRHTVTAAEHAIDAVDANFIIILLLLQYLNLKTKSANKGSKSRGAFGNHYAIYVLVEDYIASGFVERPGQYKNYPGANFSTLFARQRELPFGRKLQNHHLNSRCNDEFRKFFPASEHVPITRDLQTRRYWINEQLLLVPIGDDLTVNIAKAVIRIIDAYAAAKRTAFESFIEACSSLNTLDLKDEKKAAQFVAAQLEPNPTSRTRPRKQLILRFHGAGTIDFPRGILQNGL